MTRHQIAGLMLLAMFTVMAITFMITIIQRRREYQEEDKLSREVYRRKKDE
ncbi:hypothetical protein [Amedibacterium intestinale]|uniref:hypothetical protein n=1 Tax=Amedibacterium intestinale TaxID=2583452 RepID=UPI001314DC21|nr:hypothetical protein [Amedibacterium intestinale]